MINDFVSITLWQLSTQQIGLLWPTFELKSSRAHHGIRSVYLYAASQSQLLLDEITELAVDAITENDSSTCNDHFRQLIVNLLYPTCLSKSHQLKYKPSQCLRDNNQCRQQLQQSPFRFLLDSCQTKQNTTISLNSTTCNHPVMPLCTSVYQHNVTMPHYAQELAGLGLRIYRHSLQKLNTLTNEQSEQSDYQFYCLHLPLCNIDRNMSTSHILWIKSFSVFPNQQDVIKRRITPTLISSTTVFTENGVLLISNSGMGNSWTLKMVFTSILVIFLIT